MAHLVTSALEYDIICLKGSVDFDQITDLEPGGFFEDESQTIGAIHHVKLALTAVDDLAGDLYPSQTTGLRIE